MLAKDKLDLIDTALSIAQSLVVILGILIGALLYFLRLEHTPSVNTSVNTIGVDSCTLKIEMRVKNIGKSPFTLTNVIAAVGSDYLEQKLSLPQMITSQEEIGIFFSLPVTYTMDSTFLDVKFSLKLAEDNPETWRILDRFIAISGMSESC